MVRYLSVCSGVEAATVAWHSLGWHPVGFSEIEAFPSAVLAHRFPSVPNFGDLTHHARWNIEPGTVDLIVGGTPCQSFSKSGLRLGMADPRGNLALTFLALVDRLRPEWIVWENVRGVLSSNNGRDFGSFIGALDELRYGLAWRVLDAQHFGLAQRRRRVFVVANATDWRRAAAVLFEPQSLFNDLAPGQEEREEHSAGLEVGSVGEIGPNGLVVPRKVAACLTKSMDLLADGCADNLVFDFAGDVSPTAPQSIRRLTPLECERLQGFPDDWTSIPYRGGMATDGLRYGAVGNSMAVPVMRWIGERINIVHNAVLSEGM